MLLYPEVYLSIDDADFVDIVQTSLNTLSDQHAHAEFFVNGGEKPQPGCFPGPDDPNGKYLYVI